MSCLKIVILCASLLTGHHHYAHLVRSTPPAAAAYNPCTPGHAPVNPDAGHCRGTLYIPS